MNLRKTIFTGLFISLTPLLIAKSVMSLKEVFKGKLLLLSTAKNACKGFDYGLKGGGMRTFYCYVSSYYPYEKLTALFAKQVFIKGPHSNQQLELNAEYSFGYYNPKFVEWLIEYAIPDAEDSAFIEKSQGLYLAKIKPLADIYYLTYLKLKAHPLEVNKLKKKYLDAIAKKTLTSGYDENHYFFMNPRYFEHQENPDWFYKHGGDVGVNGNVVKTAVAWWVRRKIDGTAPLFFKGLKKLRLTYK